MRILICGLNRCQFGAHTYTRCTRRDPGARVECRRRRRMCRTHSDGHTQKKTTFKTCCCCCYYSITCVCIHSLQLLHLLPFHTHTLRAQPHVSLKCRRSANCEIIKFVERSHARTHGETAVRKGNVRINSIANDRKSVLGSSEYRSDETHTRASDTNVRLTRSTHTHTRCVVPFDGDLHNPNTHTHTHARRPSRCEHHTTGLTDCPSAHSPVRQETVQRRPLLAGHRLVNAQIRKEPLRPFGQLQSMLPLAVLPMVVMIDDAAVVLSVGDIVVGVAVTCLAIGQVRPDAGHGRRLAGAR